MIDNKHVFDYGPLRIFDSLEFPANASREKVGEDIAKMVIAAQKSTNSERHVSGQGNKKAFYITSVGTPKEGKSILQKLIKAFLEHPAFIPVNKIDTPHS